MEGHGFKSHPRHIGAEGGQGAFQNGFLLGWATLSSDYRDHNQDDSDSSEHVQVESEEEEEEEEQEPVRRPGKKPIGKKAPAKRWSDEEEVALARAWLTISENPDVGNAQKRDGNRTFSPSREGQVEDC
ncbi:hypothetical protein R6Q59_004719 [Mikania micrantha]